MIFNLLKKTVMPTADEALPGREIPFPVINRHFVLDSPILPPFPDGLKQIIVGMGCFWGAERRFWELPGVYTTAVGYAAGYTPNPTYNEVCSGMTGHNEVVRIVFNPQIVSLETILKHFWEGHDPTQGMRQGNDVGTQYRSGIYTFDKQQNMAAIASKQRFQNALTAKGLTTITTEILDAPPFYTAEEYHQQYLAKNPGGYCGSGGTGVTLDGA